MPIPFFENMRLFFKGFFQNPRTMGAVLPSSRYLARTMANCIDKTATGFIVELGPGTGAITRGILAAGISSDKIIALEVESHFAEKLKKQFPQIQVIQGNASELSTLMENKGPIDTIISSLPLRSLPKETRNKILNEIPKILSPNGRFIQFTYAIKHNDHFYPKTFVQETSVIVWRNIPPAKVNVFKIMR